MALSSALNSNPSSSPSQERLKLNNIVVVNDHDHPHEVTLRVQYDGEEIINERCSLGSSQAEQSIAFEDLPTDSGEYELEASLTDGQTSKLTPEHYPDYDCADSAVIMVNSGGNLSPFLTEPCQRDSTSASSPTTELS